MKKNIRKLSESFLHAFRGLRLCIMMSATSACT